MGSKTRRECTTAARTEHWSPSETDPLDQGFQNEVPKMGPSLRPKAGPEKVRADCRLHSGLHSFRSGFGCQKKLLFGTHFIGRRNVTVASTQAHTNNFFPQGRIFHCFNSSNADGIDRGIDCAKSLTGHTHTGLIPSHGRLAICRSPPSALPAQLAPLLLHLVSVKLSPKR